MSTPRDLRRANRTAVLRPLLLGGPQNRVVLSELTGLSSASVTNVVAELLQEGVLVEFGTEASSGGRPRVQLRANDDFGVAIGVDVGETGVRVAAFDLRFEEIAAKTVPLHPQELPAIAAAVEELRVDLEREGRRVLGAGFAVPGVVERAPEVRVHAPGIGWQAVELARVLREGTTLPIHVENGAKALGQAEMWLGAGRGSAHAVVALWGTGVGAAVFDRGSLYRGAAASAGEWGHTNLVPDGAACRCGARGCLEAYVGAEALLRDWLGRDAGELEQEEWLARLAAEAPADVLERAAVRFGTAAADLVNLFNPELIVVGGWVGLVLGPALLPRIRDIVAAQALAFPAARVAVEIGTLGPDAVALGAATLVFEELLAAGGQLP